MFWSLQPHVTYMTVAYPPGWGKYGLIIRLNLTWWVWDKSLIQVSYTRWFQLDTLVKKRCLNKLNTGEIGFELPSSLMSWSSHELNSSLMSSRLMSRYKYHWIGQTLQVSMNQTSVSLNRTHLVRLQGSLDDRVRLDHESISNISLVAFDCLSQTSHLSLLSPTSHLSLLIWASSSCWIWL